MKVTTVLPNGRKHVSDFTKGISIIKLIYKYIDEIQYPILATKIDGKYERLNHKIEESCTVYLYDMTNSYANMSYQMTLSLIYIKACRDILGKDVKIRISNSISKGLFTTIHHTNLSKETICHRVEERMQEIIQADLPILQVKKDRDALLKKYKHQDEFRLIQDAYDLQDGYVSTLDDTQLLFYQYLLPSTGYINLFDLHVYRKGIVLRFPHPSKPDTVLPFEEQNLLYEAFSEEKLWEQLLGIEDVSDLNERIVSKDYINMILLSEALHEKKIADIATMIHEKKKRIVLIAGPSSSGKTTFAKRLCIQLQVLGLKTLYLGTDDYFINRKDLVKQEDGSVDFESLNAVDVNLFTTQMNALLHHETVDLPTYNFVKGEKEFGNRVTEIGNDEVIVIEGIHGLNAKLTEGIDADTKFKIYISPLTQLCIDNYHRIPTTDARLVRRLIRDYRTRNTSAEETIASWYSVRKGEEKNIFPYNGEADVFFNSQCIYELAVLKKYAEPLLKEIPNTSSQYGEAQRILKLLQFFVSIPDDSCIAHNSIIREFIGGSILV